jgi:hypothetical protein
MGSRLDQDTENGIAVQLGQALISVSIFPKFLAEQLTHGAHHFGPCLSSADAPK